MTGTLKSWYTELYNYFLDDDDEVIVNPEPIKIKKKKKTNSQKEKLFINHDDALLIAKKDINLKKDMYLEARKQGYKYGLIQLKDFYITLVKYNKEYAWYIKVIDGIFEYKNNEKNIKDYYTEDSNIRCLILAQNGKYIYIDDKFDTNNIRFTTDEETNYFMLNVKRKDKGEQ